MGILIRGANLGGERRDILIEQDRITRIAPSVGGNLPDGLLAIEAGGLAAVPSLANAHAHSAMTLLRGIAEDMELMPWLTEAIWPVEARMTDEDVYWGTRLAAVEMARSGTTVCNDMYLRPAALARAARDSGIRFVLSYALIDGLDEAVGEAQRAACAAFFERLPDCGPLSRFHLAAHSVYATTAESIRFLARQARERGLLFHVHLAETRAEDEGCRSRTGLSPAAYLDSLGALGPWTVAAHCLWLDERDFDLLGERGVAIAHNPVSNMKLASGAAFDYGAARRRGLRVLLGTDGAASNNSLDLFADMKIAGLLQKQHYGDSRRFPVREILEAASLRGHEVFDTGAGRIEEGAAADLLLVDLGQASMIPCHDLEANLVYSGSGAVVDTTICAGKAVMLHRKVAGEEEVFAEARSRAARLARRA